MEAEASAMAARGISQREPSELPLSHLASSMAGRLPRWAT
jgi:hypothetical protein